MDIFTLSPEAFFSFLLTFMRTSIILFFLPFFGGDTIPTTVKAMVCLVLSFALWPHLSFSGLAMPAHPLGILILLFHEALFGLVMGLIVHFVFAGLQTGGEYAGMQMGFSMLTFADPMSGAQLTVMSQILNMTSLVVFLSLDGHLHLLRALTDSFSLVPPGKFMATATLTQGMIELSAGMFILAMRIAAPLFGALFLVEMTLALMGRAAPQMNLMTMGFPIKIAVGFFFLGLLFTVLGQYLTEFIIGLGPMFRHVMRAGV